MRAKLFWIQLTVMTLLAAPAALIAQTPLDAAFTYQGTLALEVRATSRDLKPVKGTLAVEVVVER